MPILVQKFGGTSVANAEKIKRAAQRAIRAQQQGNQVVVVASARGQQTDELIADAKEVNPNPPKREMDMLLSTGEQQTVSLLAMAVEGMGHKAISFTGAQVRMLTDDSYTKARIKSIDGSIIKKKLDEGYIVFVAGFQGIDEEGNITTLPRRSDTSASARLRPGHRFVNLIPIGRPFIPPTPVFSKCCQDEAISYDEILELPFLRRVHAQPFYDSQEIQRHKFTFASCMNENEGTYITH
jgi:aspartate kinase